MIRFDLLQRSKLNSGCLTASPLTHLCANAKGKVIQKEWLRTEKRNFSGASTTMAPVAVCTPMPDWEGAEERETDFQEHSQTGVWEREGKAQEVGAGSASRIERLVRICDS